MNWIKLNQDYPKAYKLMETEFNCLYTANINYKEIEKNQFYVIGSYDKSIKHPLKRDLYDFFDEQDILISIDVIDSSVKLELPFAWDIVSTKDYAMCNKGVLNRGLAETEAFIKAFEILNDRLK